MCIRDRCLTNQFLAENQLNPKLLKPIVDSTFHKIQNQDACAIQTGPAKRDDIKVENKHLQLIEDDAYLTSIYKSMSQSIKKQYENEDKWEY